MRPLAIPLTLSLARAETSVGSDGLNASNATDGAPSSNRRCTGPAAFAGDVFPAASRSHTVSDQSPADGTRRLLSVWMSAADCDCVMHPEPAAGHRAYVAAVIGATPSVAGFVQETVKSSP